MIFAALSLAASLALPAQLEPAASPAQAPAAKPATDDFKPDPAWKPLGKDLWLDAANRTLVLRARVCLREGYLEHLLCLSRTKEHESILATEATPRLIHMGLILIADEPGHPVRYRPRFEPPSGPSIQIELEWKQDGKIKKLDARNWVKDEKHNKPLETNWVFAGSEMFQDPDTKKILYAADGGDLITVANFPTAILDLPIASSNSDSDRSFVAQVSEIPPLGTPITMTFKAANPPAAQPKPE